MRITTKPFSKRVLCGVVSPVHLMSGYSTPKFKRGRYLSAAKGITPVRRGGAVAAAVRFMDRGRAREATRVRTRTATRTKSLTQQAKETRGGSESSFYKSVPGKPLAVNSKKLARNTYVLTTNSKQDSTPGVQAAFEIGAIGDLASLQGIMNTALLEQYTTLTPPGYKTERILIKSCVAEHAYTNSTNAVCRGVLYDIVPRQDIYNTSTDPVNSVLAWGFGSIEQSGTNMPGQVGCTPFMSQKFVHYYKVLKITNVILAPGQTHYHRVTYKMNHVLHNTVLQQANVAQLKGLTMPQLAVFYGQPVNDAGTGVTTEAVHILCISKYQYESTFLPNNMSLTNFTVGLSNTGGTTLEDVVTGATATFAKV